MRRFARFLGVAALCSVMAVCSSGTEPPRDGGPTLGSLRVVLERAGNGGDPDGVALSLGRPNGGVQSVSVAVGDSTVFPDLPAGQYEVSAAGLSALCAEMAPVSVPVTGAAHRVVMTADCVGQFAYDRYYGTGHQEVWYVDELGNQRRLTQQGEYRNWGFSPDGMRLLANRTASDGTIHAVVLSLDGAVTDLVAAWACTTRLYDARWAPGGSEIVAREEGASCSGDANAIVTYDAATGQTSRVVFESSGRVGADWSPTGDRLALLLDDGVYVEDVKTRTRSLAYQLPSGRLPLSLHWSPTADVVLVAVSNPTQLLAIDVSTGMLLGAADGGLVSVWRPDGQGFAYVEAPQSLKYYDLATGTVSSLVAGYGESGTYPSYSSQTGQVLFQSLVNVYLAPTASGAAVRQLTATSIQDGSQARAPRWRFGRSYPR